MIRERSRTVRLQAQRFHEAITSRVLRCSDSGAGGNSRSRGRAAGAAANRRRMSNRSVKFTNARFRRRKPSIRRARRTAPDMQATGNARSHRRTSRNTRPASAFRRSKPRRRHTRSEDSVSAVGAGVPQDDHDRFISPLASCFHRAFRATSWRRRHTRSFKRRLRDAPARVLPSLSIIPTTNEPHVSGASNSGRATRADTGKATRSSST
jgi:hypothetical protein